MKYWGEIEKGQFDNDGNIWIEVIIDGSWSKRSHKTNYNAYSGCCVVIGKETGKIIDIEFKNKYWLVCFRDLGKDIKN